MFQRLTSLFFGAPPPPEDSECPRAFVSEEDEVDGWLIIDLPDSYAAPGATPAPAGRPPPAPSFDGRELVCYPSRLFTAEGPGLGPGPPPEQPPGRPPYRAAEHVYLRLRQLYNACSQDIPTSLR
uniref:Tumor protein p53 inducible nuclear protein 2 n=1 Tax=Oryctolagus cuniculus TaxID=9986 RepID=G1SXL1_RABIT